MFPYSLITQITRRSCRLFVIWQLFSLPVYAQSTENAAVPNPAPPPTPLTDTSATQRGTNPTPVEQALVPEGVFAMRLVEALNLGKTVDLVKAEELLSNLAIEPKNGWISEYPVTPAVLGEIDKDIAEAAGQGKITLSKDETLKRVAELKTKLGLDISPGPGPNFPQPSSPQQQSAVSKIYTYTNSSGARCYTDDFNSIPPEYRDQAKIVAQYTPQPSPPLSGGASGVTGPQYTAVPDPNVINNYYLNQGPPVVTYYSPPTPFYYLYSWAPYPFWSAGYYFPGYFVLNNFRRHLVYNQTNYYVSRHNYDNDHDHLGHHDYVSHHAGPGNMTFQGSSTTQQPTVSNWYAMPNAQTGARAIAALNQHHPVNESGDLHRQMPNNGFSSTINSPVLNNLPTVHHERTFLEHGPIQQAPFSGGRVFNSPPTIQQPIINQPAYVPETHLFHSQPIFHEEHQFQSQPIFEEQRQFHSQNIFNGSGEHHGGGGVSRGGGRH